MGVFHLNLRSDKLKEKDHFEDPVGGDRIILKCIFKEQGWGIRTGFIWLKAWTSGGFLLSEDDVLGSTKCVNRLQ